MTRRKIIRSSAASVSLVDMAKVDLLEQEYLDDGKQVSPHGLLMMVLDSPTVLNYSERPWRLRA